MTCDASTTISAQDMTDLKADITTIDVVVESTDLTTTTKDGNVIDTLTGRLLKLGFQAPVAYAGAISFTTNDATKTIDRLGIIYAPFPTGLPFTTTGTWGGDDEDKFYIVQGLSTSDRIAPSQPTPTALLALSTTLSTGTIAFVHDSIKFGWWYISAGALNDNADNEGFVKTNATWSAASKHWRRLGSDVRIDTRWFGADPAETAANNVTAFQNALFSTGFAADYNAGRSYTNSLEWVSESGNFYSPKLTALPIGPEAFNAANWNLESEPKQRALFTASGTYNVDAGLAIQTGSSTLWQGEGGTKTIINLTGSVSHILINLLSDNFCAFEDIGFQYDDALYTGTLITLNNTSRSTFSRCMFRGLNSATAAHLVNMLGAAGNTNIVFDQCWFTGADILIKGYTTGASTGVEIRGCFFDNHVTAPIKDIGEGWVITGNLAEPSIDGFGFFINQDASLPCRGVTIKGNWIGDATALGAFTCIVINGRGIDISGNFINGTGNNNVTAVAINAATDGLIYKGNYIASMLTSLAMGSNLLSQSDITPNVLETVTNRTTGTTTFLSNVHEQEVFQFNPEFKFGGASIGVTYSKNSGFGNINGKQFFFQVELILTSKGSSTGAVTMEGFPSFTSISLVGAPAVEGFWNNILEPYNAAKTYTVADNLVDQGGVIYRPDPASLPIGPEAFDPAKWISTDFNVKARVTEGSNTLQLGKSGSPVYKGLVDTDIRDNTHLTLTGWCYVI